MAYINQNGELINSEIVTCFDGAVCHIEDAVYVESINHFAQYDQVIAGQNGYELLPELMANLRSDANFVDCEKTVRILNKELSQLRDSNKRGLFLEAHKKRDEAMKKLSKSLHSSTSEKTMTTQSKEKTMSNFTLNTVLDSIRSDIQDVLSRLTQNEIDNLTPCDVCDLLDENHYLAPEVIYYADAWEVVAGSSFNDYEAHDLDFTNCNNSLDCIIQEANALVNDAYYCEREAIAAEMLADMQSQD